MASIIIGCVFSLYKTEDVLRSPNYPSNYPENLDLQFRIVTGTNATHENSADVTLQFLFMEIEDNECQYDYLQVRVYCHNLTTVLNFKRPW